MELSTVRGSFDHIAKKQKLSSSRCHEIVDTIGLEIEQALTRCQSNHDATRPKSMLTELKTKLNEFGLQNELESLQKELNMDMSRYLKLLEKVFIPDISKAYRKVEFDVQTINQIVINDFFRQGLFDIGDCLTREAGTPEVDALRVQLFEMYQILEAVRAKNLQPALKWVAVNHEKLKENGSSLELKLHQLQFVEILKQGSQTDALNYARANLAPFGPSHMNEVQKLMACLLWVGRLESCPYFPLLASTSWEKLADELSQQFCVLLGQSSRSSLTVTIEAGIAGLPTLLKLANLMVAKKHEWQTMKQLPVPIDLSNEFQFHSVFVCPVSRDQGTEDNPPMLLPCGHVLCRQSIMKLSKNNSRNFKCPYCPLDAAVAHCRQLFF